MPTVEGKEEISWTTVEGMETLTKLNSINRGEVVDSVPVVNFCTACIGYPRQKQ